MTPPLPLPANWPSDEWSKPFRWVFDGNEMGWASSYVHDRCEPTALVYDVGGVVDCNDAPLLVVSHLIALHHATKGKPVEPIPEEEG